MFDEEYTGVLGAPTGGSWAGTDEVDGYGSGASSGPSITLAGMLFLLIGLKAFTESNLISTDLAEIKLSLLNIVTILAVVLPGIVGFKVATAAMAAKGLALPGQQEIAAAI